MRHLLHRLIGALPRAPAAPTANAATPPDVVAVELLGGLGNQLFQYACARTLSLRAGSRLLLDASTIGRSHTRRDYALAPFSIAGTVVHAACDLPAGLIDAQEGAMPFDASVLDLPAGTRLRGFFQSELYFREAAATLRVDLRPRHPLSATAQGFLQKIRAVPGSIAIQVRRGDMADDPDVQGAFGICERAYYERALAIAASLGANGGEVFVFSDDRRAASELLQALPAFTMVHSEQDWEELILMGACRHHIIANSSFGWWGAWLAGDQGVLVAPRRWFGARMLRENNICDLLPGRAVLA